MPTSHSRTVIGKIVLPEWASKPRSARSAFLWVLRWWTNRLLTMLLIAWLGLGGIAGWLGYHGFKEQYCAEGKERSRAQPSREVKEKPPSDLVYLTLQLVTLQCGNLNDANARIRSAKLNWARFLIPFLGLFTAGTAVAAVFRKRSESLQLRLYSDHVVICGLGRKGFQFAKAFLSAGQDVVVIEADDDNDFIEQCKADGAMVLIGDATDRGLLERANVRRARRVICLCRDDGTNAEVGFRVRDMVSASDGNPIVCQMHIFATQLFDLLRGRLPHMPGVKGCKLEFFNIFKNGAWTMLHEFSPYDRERLEKEGCAHILVVGLGWIGESVVVQAAVKWRRHERSGLRPKVTVVDREAERLVGAMASRYRDLMEVFEFRARDMEVESAEFEKGDFLAGDNGNCDIGMVYVCFDDPSLALTAALTLHQTLERATPGRKVPIVVKMDHNDGLAKILPGDADHSGGYSGLHAFGLLDRTCQPELIYGDITEIVARQMHQHYLDSPKRGAAHADKTVLPAMKPWEELSKEDKDSNRESARHITKKMDMIACVIGPMSGRSPDLHPFTDQEINLLARVEHERWFQYKVEHGWKWGKVHDRVHKENPYLRHWENLPEKQKELARETIRDIPEILAAADLEIYRAG